MVFHLQNKLYEWEALPNNSSVIPVLYIRPLPVLGDVVLGGKNKSRSNDRPAAKGICIYIPAKNN